MSMFSKPRSRFGKPKVRFTKKPSQKFSNVIKLGDGDVAERLTHSGDYLLANCLVLFAAVLGTQRSYDFAMHSLPIARKRDYLTARV